MPDNEKQPQKPNNAYSNTTNWNQSANPFGRMSSVTPEQLLENLKRIENIVTEISRIIKK